VHPIERLRHVARAGAVDDYLLVREAAGGLASLGDDPAGMVTSARRLLSRHPASGPLWWLTARALTAGDPFAEAWRAVDELESDTTAREVALALPDEATITVVGSGPVLLDALPRRGDLEVLAVDCYGEARRLLRRLDAADVEAVEVPDPGAGAAAGASDAVVLEALVLGPDAFVAAPGSWSVAAVAASAGIPVWLVAGAGRALPDRLWQAVRRILDHDDPWDADVEVVPLSLVDTVVGPSGPCPAAGLNRADCAVAPELLKDLG
jgi:hypothetical protein